jgi:hypothetical protein
MIQTSQRPRELGGNFNNRRGHVAQLSISDTNHHVTEAIGDMYGDDDEYGQKDPRPLSFVASPLSDTAEVSTSYFDGANGSKLQKPRSPSSRPGASPNGHVTGKSQTLPIVLPSQRSNSDERGQLSPAHALRSNSLSHADKKLPLNDIDYQSTPAAVAQELSNLQALRRMSMDVGNTSDPDLPSFQGVSLMPSVAPVGDDDEDDPSRLFWVPARVHPELAPMEFKTFIENRVNSIKRRSGEFSSLSPDGPERSGSGASLRRKKSMLSRQIDNSHGRGAVGYRDGAEELQRKRSSSQHRVPELKISDLKELDELVRDPTSAMQKFTLDTNQRGDVSMEDPNSEDLPILPAAPGIGLQRSRRTTYRKGSLKRGERAPFAQRIAARKEQAEAEESSAPTSSSPVTEGTLTRVASEPSNFSRPGRGGRRAGVIQPPVPTITLEEYNSGATGAESSPQSPATPSSYNNQPLNNAQETLPPRKSSRRTETPIPRIVETPPPADRAEDQIYKQQYQHQSRKPEEQAYRQQNAQYQQYAGEPFEEQGYGPPQRSSTFPERSTSQPLRDEPPPRSSRRPGLARQQASTAEDIPKVSTGKTLNDMVQQPSPLLGHSDRTDSLTFIPTLTEEKKPEKKLRKEEPEPAAAKKSKWGWFKGSDDKEKEEKEKKKDDESKKSKGKTVVDKGDNARLDVLQHTLDAAVQRGRESLLLDRESIDNKLSDERKKESTRKSGDGIKKEKEGIFSSFFSSKKKADKETGSKKASSLRTLSPEPPHKQLRPDIDYSWTRFPLLEERAIYRMAHIKLANPRRALYSQVLLSNFMYSYLAKVQQMHPHVQIPQSAQQKKQLEMERRQREQEQRKLLEQQQQAEQQYKYDYHQASYSEICTGRLLTVLPIQGIADYADQQPDYQQNPSGGVTYIEDSQNYNYDHQENDLPPRGGDRPPSGVDKHPGENGYASQSQHRRQGADYYSYGAMDHGGQRNHQDDEGDMW